MNYLFFTDFIYWTPCENHYEIKKSILPKINRNLRATEGKNKWKCNVNTEFFTQFDTKVDYDDLISRGVFPALDRMFEELTFLKRPTRSSIMEIWYNKYTAGGHQEVHSHGHDAISGIYFLELDEPNTTVFYSNHANELVSFVPSSKVMNEVREGYIVLFPSHLLHYVMPCTKNRITISFNIECEFS